MEQTLNTDCLITKRHLEKIVKDIMDESGGGYEVATSTEMTNIWNNS